VSGRAFFEPMPAEFLPRRPRAICFSAAQFPTLPSNGGSLRRPAVCRRWLRESQKFQVGGDLLEKHVRPGLDHTSPFLRGAQKWNDFLLMTTSPASVVGAILETFMGSGSPACIPSGVALTTMAYPAGSFEPRPSTA
jgi:hypothetical protein